MTIHLSDKQAELLGGLLTDVLRKFKDGFEYEGSDTGPDSEVTVQTTEIANAVGANIDWDSLDPDASEYFC